ncbi:hypothetical protein G9A89_020796 [Geosiphon pyriformis]|nr:hypothetical protein G9A89_020796 [Geosiphon pyriformis]
MKAVHFKLPVAVQKRLYNKDYSGVSCLFCGDVELSNHSFTCVKDVFVRSDILGDFGGLWKTLMDLFLGMSDVGLYLVFCKEFVLKSWMDETIASLGNKKKAAFVVVDFVHHLAESHRINLWLFRTKFRSDMKRSGLISNDVVVASAPSVGALSLSAGMVCLTGVLDSLDVSFSFRNRFLFLSGAVYRVSVSITEKEIGHNCDSRKTTTITTESLSIIQKTSQQNLQINQNFQILYLLHIIHESIILQRTSTDNTKPKVAESEIIGANHLGFAKSLFQHYSFNFYVNEKISSLLRTPINKEIEHHTQQRYPITYTSKGKGKLQTPAVTPRKIQPPAWKKNRVESPSNPSYHYTPGSAINISSTDMFPSTVTSPFGQFSFQNFGISDPWEAAESEKEEEELQDQEFTYQHPITKNPEVETLNIQTWQQLENPENENLNIQMPPNQRNQNPELINQQNLPPVIVIDQLPINPIAEPIQQPLQLPPQQPGQQQLLQQPPQPPNLDPIIYAPITKLDNFMGKENDTQIWLNNVEKTIAANGWNDA